MRVADALAWAVARLSSVHTNSCRRDTELLLQHATGWNRAFVLAHEDAVLGEEARVAFCETVERRALDEPVQYILGRQEFWGLDLEVTPAVLIPRPETEHVVEAVLTHVAKDEQSFLADIGTGSGAIAIALAGELPLSRIVATDVSSAALQVARRNALRHGVLDRIEFVECDLLPATLSEELDAVVSNPPYVAERDRQSLARQVRDFEPETALFAGQDGMDFYRRLVPAAYVALRPGGWLVLEIGQGQAEQVGAMLPRWTSTSTMPDLQGIDRVLISRKPVGEAIGKL